MPFTSILALIGTIGGLVLLASFVFIYWKKGGNDAATAANTSLLQLSQANKLQLEQAQKDIAGLQERERGYLGEIGMLKGELKSKNDQIAILQQVDISKNPTLMKFIEGSAKREERILTALESLSGLSGVMSKIEKHFDDEHAKV